MDHHRLALSRSRTVATLLLGLAAGLAGCGSHDPGLAPTATAETLAPSKPASQSATKYTISPASTVGFQMEAPEEKIRGRVDKAASGELFIDPADLTKTTGNVAVDISTLELYQRKMEGGAFTEETKSDLQNQHARAWLEIDESAPADIRKRNSRVEFAIRKIESVSEKSVLGMTGNDRKVTVKASGDFLLHGRQSQKTVDLEVTFHFDGSTVKSVTVKSVAPIPIGLAEHDVHPREAFGKLAQKTLSVLAPKVAKEAQVELEIIASPGDTPLAASSAVASAAAPEASAEVAASASAASSAAGSAAPTPSVSASPPATATPKPHDHGDHDHSAH